MNSQNQNSQEETKKASQTSQSEDLKSEDLKNVKGGSGLLSGGNDLTNLIGGSAGISNSSSGSDGTHSYTSNDSHNLDLGLGNELSNLNF